MRIVHDTSPIGEDPAQAKTRKSVSLNPINCNGETASSMNQVATEPRGTLCILIKGRKESYASTSSTRRGRAAQSTWCVPAIGLVDSSMSFKQITDVGKVSQQHCAVLHQHRRDTALTS
jgi:hypothetical protein